LYFGGPVQTDTIHFLHTLGSKLEGSKELIPGIFWGGELETLKILIDTGQVSKNDIRFFRRLQRLGTQPLDHELRGKPGS
jgi:putative transcriptional regulator